MTKTRWGVVTNTRFVTRSNGGVAWTYDLLDAQRTASYVSGWVVDADDYVKHWRDYRNGKLVKSRTVLVKCLVVDSDGYAVNGHGGMLRRNEKPFYEWEPRRRKISWLRDPKNRKLWREVSNG